MIQDLHAIRVLEGTKVSHDYEGKHIETFSYRDLINRGIPAIGIPCKMNRLLIIDVDVEGPTHKKDGREWWTKFATENGIPETYTVQSASGGFHFYFRLPESVNPDTFSPPAELAPGVDIKWNGWVGAPPTQGYSVIRGNVTTTVVAPPSLMAEISAKIKGRGTREFEFTGNYSDPLQLHRPFSPEQIIDLRHKIHWAQNCATLSRSEWRDGLFSLKAGVEDPQILHELAEKWTYNQSYQPGDEQQAFEIVERAERHGGVGPGTIFGILKNVAMRTGAPLVASPFSKNEVLDRSKVPMTLQQNGSFKVEPSESNASHIIGAMFDADMLYTDTRQDSYIYKGKPISDVELMHTLTPMLQSVPHGLGLEKFKMGLISGGMELLLNSRQVDPHEKWLQSLKWDGIQRIDTFWVNYVGVEDSEYIRAVGKNFWIALAARGLKPGIKFDSIFVLEGVEGIRKSSLVEAIGGEYTFTPSTDDLMDNLDDLRKMHQSIIVELPELMGLMGQKPTKVQAFITKPFDHIRALYAKRAMKKPRGFIIVGTTNNKRYLSLEMGVRRFLPIEIPKEAGVINMGAIQADREQLFAEGVHRFKAGEPFHIVPMNDLKERVANKTLSEPLMGPIKDLTPMLGPEFRIADVYQRLELGGFIPRGLNAQVAKRIETALKTIGAQEFDTDSGPKWTLRSSEPVSTQYAFNGEDLNSLDLSSFI